MSLAQHQFFKGWNRADATTASGFTFLKISYFGTSREPTATFSILYWKKETNLLKTLDRF